MPYYVDLPNANGEWETAWVFKTKEEAVEWIREVIGHCDDDGNLGLITEIKKEDMKDEDDAFYGFDVEE